MIITFKKNRGKWRISDNCNLIFKKCQRESLEPVNIISEIKVTESSVEKNPD